MKDLGMKIHTYTDPFLKYLSIFVRLRVLSACLCTMCVQCQQRPEEGVGSLQVELQPMESFRVGAGNGTAVLSKSSQCSWPLRHLSSPPVFFFFNLRRKLVVHSMTQQVIMLCPQA